jgi:hypothetical protein
LRESSFRCPNRRCRHFLELKWLLPPPYLTPVDDEANGIDAFAP